MSKDKISDYSATANSNTDIGGINIDEGCAPSGINDAIRTLMKQLKDWQSGSQDVYIHPAGSASVPSITATGDTNTGMFFPAADTVGIATGGTERARVDSSGNLGLGVTPSAWSSGRKILQLPNGTAYSDIGGYASVSNNWYFNNAELYVANGYATRYYTGGGQHVWQNAASNSSGAGAALTWSTAMTLDASGNLGLGTTSPNISGQSSSVKIVSVSGTGNNWGGLELNNPSASGGSLLGFIGWTGSNMTAGYNMPAYIGTWLASGTANKQGGELRFHTQSDNTAGATERARIDSSGNLLVGTTTKPDTNLTGVGIVSTVGKWALAISANNRGYVYSATNDGYPAYFVQGGSTVGYIATTSTTTTYATSSDYRLKNNIAPMTDALAKVAALKPVTYKWNADGSNGEGFIAHELAEVCPQAVTGAKDAVDEDGNPVYQGIDTSFLVATLTAALQEAHGLIKDLQTRITALEQA